MVKWNSVRAREAKKTTKTKWELTFGTSCIIPLFSQLKFPAHATLCTGLGGTEWWVPGQQSDVLAATKLFGDFAGSCTSKFWVPVRKMNGRSETKRRIKPHCIWTIIYPLQMAEPFFRRGWVPPLVPGPAQRRPPPGLCRGQGGPIAIFRKDTYLPKMWPKLYQYYLRHWKSKHWVNDRSSSTLRQIARLLLDLRPPLSDTIENTRSGGCFSAGHWTYQSVSQQEFRELHFQLDDLQILRHGPSDIIWLILISFYHKMSGWNLCLCVL